MRTRVAALVCVLAASAVANSTASAAGRPAGVTWAGRHFTTAVALGTWLHGRGITYSEWAARHPAGVYLLSHPKPKPKPKPKPALAAVVPPRPQEASPAAFVVLPVAALLVLLGLFPLRRLELGGYALPSLLRTRTLELRVTAFASAAVLLVGLVLTQTLG